MKIKYVKCHLVQIFAYVPMNFGAKTLIHFALHERERGELSEYTLFVE